MSVINRYGPVVQQYGSPEQLAQQDPRLLNQIITELGQSGEAQDQAAYEQLKEYYSPSVGGGAFIVHQDMKDAMTRQQQAYAQPVQPQPTGNPVYNAAVAAAKKSEPVITQAAVPDGPSPVHSCRGEVYLPDARVHRQAAAAVHKTRGTRRCQTSVAR